MPSILNQIHPDRMLQLADPDTAAAINAVWILVAGIFCFQLQAGFGLLEVGSVRAKNAQNIMLKNLMDISITAICYYAVGFAFAYGESSSKFIGNANYFLIDSEDYVLWFFQFVFAGTTATIVSGSVAERCRFRAYIWYTIVLTSFVYPVTSHWIWSPQGFFFGKVLDFAGSGAVHLLGGAAAMAGSYFVGPRIGKFDRDPVTGKVIKTNVIPGHNAVLAALGAFILWGGFFAFNGGSCIAVFCPATTDTGRIIVSTTLSAAAGGIFMLFLGEYRFGIYDLKLSMNGLLAGMVAICSGVLNYHVWMAIPIGILGALGYYAQELLFEHVLFIDDPLGASALHMGAGIVGVLVPAFFAHPDFTAENQVGIFYGGSANILGWQIGACLVYFLWGFGATSILAFWPLNALGLLRVSEEHELAGLDVTHHGGPAYDLSPEEATYQLPAKGGTSSIGTDSNEATKQLDIASGFDTGGAADVEGEELLTEQPENSAEILKEHPFAVTKGAM